MMRGAAPALAGVLLACISCMKIEGTITSEGDALGEWVLVPEKCMTGDRERRVGAALYTEDDPRLSVRVLHDFDRGIATIVAIPSSCGNDGRCEALVIDPRRCTRYSADVRLTNVMTPDDFRKADGHLELDCAVAIGSRRGRLHGGVRFRNCD